MRALITGINGFVGGHLAEYLLHIGGWEVWGVALEPHLRLATIQDGVQLKVGDLRDAKRVSDIISEIQPEVIFHLAGQPFVPESFRDPSTTFDININAQLNIFLALLQHKIQARVLVVSSFEVYGQIQPEDIPIDEQTPFRPANPYGVSKIAQDLLGLQYTLSHDLDIIRVRPFNHIGPRQNERFVASAFARQIASIEQGKQPPVMYVGNLAAERDFTDVRDMVQAYVLAVQKGGAGEVYNIGSGQPVVIQSLLDTLLKMSSVTIDVQQDPDRMRPADIPKVVCDASKFRNHTGWTQHYSFDQTVHDILNDWRVRVAQ
jgi:GDP-4-dehydro-6-deoxy-D-mannose reductase